MPIGCQVAAMDSWTLWRAAESDRRSPAAGWRFWWGLHTLVRARETPTPRGTPAAASAAVFKQPDDSGTDWKLEVVVIPESDVDRAAASSIERAWFALHVDHGAGA